MKHSMTRLALTLAIALAAQAAQASPPLPLRHDFAQACQALWGGESARSRWVKDDGQGGLAYAPLNGNGDHVMDFSSAGYMGGGVALPIAPVKATVQASGNAASDLANIQAAIAKVAALPAVNGVRGAVLLAPGTFLLSSPIQLASDGVVLRGSGSGAGGTVLKAQGDGHAMLSLGASAGSLTPQGSTVAISDSYVPSGSSVIHVANASGFQPGDTVIVRRKASAEWIHFMEMDQLFRDGKPQTWINAGNSSEYWLRAVAAVSGNQLTLDIPLSDSFDSGYLGPNGGSVQKYQASGITSQIGAEHLALEGLPRGSGADYGVANLDNLADGWLNDIQAHNFTSGVVVGKQARRLTLEAVALTHDHNNIDCKGAKEFEFSIAGSQVLVDRSASTGSKKSFYYATQAQAGGPNVLLNFSGRAEACGNIEPHQRWATGLLVDNADVSGAIALGNRGADGSGHGWSMGWGVVWNAKADQLDVAAPPGASNWAIGSSGALSPDMPDAQGVPAPPQLGAVDSANVRVGPDSLYLMQLCQRLGPQAVKNIGYAASPKTANAHRPLLSR
ncbi:glycoside hydrolase family 55 protein [Chromobacterium sp. IIBBL 290-4]|uniref:glycoside hydrolase family 55 protein n=1 Tax=Chromobacterium sp. IIBBL 290-4 TaxID=2953890 RepID=UPI0020B6BFE4|nr:glycoside hydrolase family 55 protein [Chromobacterium sp. IIBBL 290-4]UTH75371.1 glycoside hydrolase family 55 protein [Chromobacterium sp. IIBBL 290-4]